MRANHSVELTAGLFMIIGIAALVLLSLQSTNISGALHSDSYEVVARFANVGDLKPRAPVTLAGVQVGSVQNIALDGTTFEALVTLKISSEFDDIPNDSAASVLTSGVLGDQYIGLEPGGALDALKEGDEILITQSAVVLEQLIGKFMFNANNNSNNSESGADEDEPLE